MTLGQSIKDAKTRAKKTGLDWHVILVYDELNGPQHETVSSHHPGASEAVWTARAYTGPPIKGPSWLKRLGRWLSKTLKKL